ncbi:N-(5'-phosphoribosyl)anthranilate isomerase [Clostridia bacterium]|nr:N-(5'-phosphoribosyl)anthranilate isomerase [Clostridia bacterium]
MEYQPKIKICGLTREIEADYLNEFQVDYAGFVFFEKSKRNISMEKALKIKKCLALHIKTVAVTVEPEESLWREIEAAGFDVIQVHQGKEIVPEQNDPPTLRKDLFSYWDTPAGIVLLKQGKLPIWQAVNVSEANNEQIVTTMQYATNRICGYVLDGPKAGSGQAFSWEEFPKEFYQEKGDKLFILAGGLHTGNVEAAIKSLHPDVVDVSSGVEGDTGKSKEKIGEFVAGVRRMF